MSKITWKKAPVATLTFNSLGINESFKIVNLSGRATGAVYRKVYNVKDRQYYQMEEETGRIYPATASRVERVEVEVTIHADKPR